jgi:hypothetical protein
VELGSSVRAARRGRARDVGINTRMCMFIPTSSMGVKLACVSVAFSFSQFE